MSARRLAGAAAAAWLVLLAAAFPGFTRAAAAQEAGPVSPDSADAIRAALPRPPGEPPFGMLDALSVPLRLAVAPVVALGHGVRALLSVAFRPGPPGPVSRAVSDARAWGFSGALGGLGPRAGPGARVQVSRLDPLVLEAGLSLRGSWRAAAGAVWTAGSTELAGEASVRRFAEPHFWGVGPDTEAEGRADYRWDRAELSGIARVARGPLRWRVEAGVEENRTGPGSDDGVPDLTERPDAGELFGLGERTRFVRLGAEPALDLTRPAAFQTRGFRASAGPTAFLSLGGTRAHFVRWRAEASAYLSPNPRQQLALHGRAVLHRQESGGGVPFTHLASLGGDGGLRPFAGGAGAAEGGLRSYDDGRFRGRDLLALASEWRYEVWRSIHDNVRAEGVLFLDLGTVGDEGAPLDLGRLRASWGVGARLVTTADLVALGYAAFGGEGTRLRAAFSWAY